MNTIKVNFLKSLSKGYIIGLGLMLGIGSALAITALTTETSWTESSFENGASITQNMLLAQTMGYTCYNSTCSQKVYWKKFNGSQYSINDASKLCMDNGMVLPTSDQIRYYSAYNLYGYDYSGGYVGMQSTTNAGSRHWGNTIRGGNSSCSTPGYTCAYYQVGYPNSRSSQTQQRGYSQLHTLCVYKQW